MDDDKRWWDWVIEGVGAVLALFLIWAFMFICFTF